MKSATDITVNGRGRSFAIVAARFNYRLVDPLLRSVQQNLERSGVGEEDIEVLRVPGSHELPYAVKALAESDRFDCLIAIGVVIAGETQHHAIIGKNVSAALIAIAGETAVPVINGLIVADNLEQARARCCGEIDRAREFALAAVDMADLRERLGIHRGRTERS